MKSALSTKYGDLIGFLPNLKWETVIPPDFFESYAKYPWAYISVWSPMILIALLLAPTVPSDPSPQNLQALVPSGVASISATVSNEVLVTSSTIEIVNPSFGSSLAKFA